jgi:protein SCO1
MLPLVLFVCAVYAQAAQHKAQGLVLKTDPEHRSIVVSCDAIEGYMPAMDMPLHIEHASVFTWLKAGTMVRFTIIDVGRRAVARNIQALVNFEPEPAEAGSLLALRGALHVSDAPIVEVGQLVPEFTLTDQVGKQIRLSELRGKLVILTFGYSRCPYPTYCLRLSNNLAQIANDSTHARDGISRSS